MKKKIASKIALAFSVCLFIVWGILGTGSTLSWFSDTAPSIKNNFIVPELDLKVSYKNDVVTDYTVIESGTRVFNDQAIYEPGYTQVVYLTVRTCSRSSTLPSLMGPSCALSGSTVSLTTI